MLKIFTQSKRIYILWLLKDIYGTDELLDTLTSVPKAVDEQAPGVTTTPHPPTPPSSLE